MAIKITNDGELLLIDWALNNGTRENLTLKLYSNNYVPVDTSEAADFTEATFVGYSDKALTAGSWIGPITNAQGKAELEYTEQSWDSTSQEDIYGYYVVGATSGTCLWAEKFGSYRPLNNGDTLRVVPKITCKSEY